MNTLIQGFISYPKTSALKLSKSRFKLLLGSTCIKVLQIFIPKGLSLIYAPFR